MYKINGTSFELHIIIKVYLVTHCPPALTCAKQASWRNLLHYFVSYPAKWARYFGLSPAWVSEIATPPSNILSTSFSSAALTWGRDAQANFGKIFLNNLTTEISAGYFYFFKRGSLELLLSDQISHLVMKGAPPSSHFPQSHQFPMKWCFRHKRIYITFFPTDCFLSSPLS